jgi:exosome complex RNA-binding protein Csl4
MIRFGQGRDGFFHLCVILALSGLLLAADAVAAQDAQKPGASVAKAVGTIQIINGKNLTVASDAGTTVHVVIEDSTRLLRTEPGAKDLKGATPITLSECAPGDRVLVRGTSATDGQSLVALSVIVIKHADVAAKQQQEVEDWQKRGIGGLVTKSDPAAGTVTISTASLSGIKPTTIQISKQTIVRRYSPDSVKFDDATPATLDQIKPGDQLRARGTKSADNTELTAEEVVFGTFRNIAGLVLSTDPSSHSVSVQDLSTKKPVVLRIDSASELRSLPPAVAQRIAARLKGAPEGASGAASSGQGGGAPSGGAAPTAANRGSGRADFQQMLNRMPAVSLADLEKGAAVMIVATEGSPQSPPTAITLLTGVEPILTASPDSRRAAMLLSPWNLGGSESEGNQ